MPLQSELVGPLVLAPIRVERIWGVTSLAPWFEGAGMEKPIGEVWLTAEECVIEGGTLAGRTLAEAAKAFPKLLADEATGGFPLLIKILFPEQKLSVQVHPNDEQARASGTPRGKTECWYVLTAEPGATVAVGFREPITVDQVREAIEQGTLEDKLQHLPVAAGDMVYVDAGTVHAIGPGVVILETQQYSDVTYRLYDYGRPRELHLDEGLAVTRTETEAGLVLPVIEGSQTVLVKSPYFKVSRLAVEAGTPVDLGSADELQLLIALGEGCSIEPAGGGDVLTLPKAEVVLLPGEGVEYRALAVGGAEIIQITR